MDTTTRYLIRASDPVTFEKAKALVAGKVRVFVTSDRRLYLSAGDVPEGLQDDLREAGARVTVERPAFSPG